MATVQLNFFQSTIWGINFVQFSRFNRLLFKEPATEKRIYNAQGRFKSEQSAILYFDNILMHRPRARIQAGPASPF